ncbi:MAG: hypothetical protein L0Z55_01175 [Planctomycetes bacterium]|nr:hypothetical protein [Planctomycetota bacterium]
MTQVRTVSCRASRRIARAVFAALALAVVPACRETDLEGAGILTRDIAALPGNDCPQPDPLDLPVRINEIVLQNVSAFPDEHGLFPPWLELVNTSDQPVDVGGAFLSDDILLSEKWQIPCIPEAEMAPGGFLVIFMDGDQEPDDLHASFLPPATGTLTFVLNTGSDVLEIEADLLGADVAFGRAPDGGDASGILQAPTPGAPNAPLSSDLVPKFVRGDANESGAVTAEDVDLLLEILASLAPLPACPDRLDANDDGAIDVGDAGFLALAIAGGGPAIPAPFPTAGIDPTPDSLPPCED